MESVRPRARMPVGVKDPTRTPRCRRDITDARGSQAGPRVDVSHETSGHAGRLAASQTREPPESDLRETESRRSARAGRRCRGLDLALHRVPRAGSDAITASMPCTGIRTGAWGGSGAPRDFENARSSGLRGDAGSLSGRAQVGRQCSRCRCRWGEIRGGALPLYRPRVLRASVRSGRRGYRPGVSACAPSHCRIPVGCSAIALWYRGWFHVEHSGGQRRSARRPAARSSGRQGTLKPITARGGKHPVIAADANIQPLRTKADAYRGHQARGIRGSDIRGYKRIGRSLSILRTSPTG